MTAFSRLYDALGDYIERMSSWKEVEERSVPVEEHLQHAMNHIGRALDGARDEDHIGQALAHLFLAAELSTDRDTKRLWVVRIVQTCESVPSQWEGFLSDGRTFYIRYRFGHLRMTAHPTFPLSEDADRLVDLPLGDDMDGEMSYSALRKVLKRNVNISFPSRMESDNLFHHHIVPSLDDLAKPTAKIPFREDSTE